MRFQTSCSSVLSNPKSRRLAEACALLLIKDITDNKRDGGADKPIVRAK